MSESTADIGLSKDEKPVNDVLTLKRILWTVAQPILVLGSAFLVATMISDEWMNHKLYAVIMILLPVPLLLLAERIWTKRKDWLLKPHELYEDGFWLAFAALLWGPIISDAYRTPVSEGFRALRDRSSFDITIAPESAWGLVAGAILLRICASFPYYWLHRVQHESVFFWRMHATHHHITKMGCLRGDRTHPLEYLALGISTPIFLALLGASDDVIAVAAAFGMWNGKLNHSNLPLISMPVYDWIFATAQQHHCHHAHDRAQADSNYGCQIILWDRIFGTYCGDNEVGQIGAGKAVPLSIKEQLLLAFYPTKRLINL
ncbi:MAG: sterol desaturase family protein [Pseudomonadales bacterium]|nr:sterol desaturase family protein [Pseudomonadales bacterium]MBO6563182.1 sterol desaturase family protein [Pseudomonadales bacterium]MBO6597279.1 sterol desaturase family protein [Pseudomonadales bacterium]MBO6656906.1 sterol desaturase family protein [Pseudomonadales bacterium]MBO6703908.1 sterol desaturase family protein [Pseudomonadales bacterium]